MMNTDKSGYSSNICIYEQLTDMNNLLNSFSKCKKGVRWKCSVQRYELSELYNAYNLMIKLQNKDYKQKSFYEFDINERGKLRHIKSLHISDRVLQRALCDYILTPILLPYLIYDNGASIKGKGVDFTRKRLKQHLWNYYSKYGIDGYVLQIDFSKFFDNIPHDKLIEMFSEKIHDQNVIDLIKQLVYSFGDIKGVGIGSQLSQIAGIYYPYKIDNYCKIVMQCKYYARYMDDIIIIHNDKEYLKKVYQGVLKICDDLGIVINNKKTQLIKLSQGFAYLQMRYIVTDAGRIVVKPNNKTFKRERRKLKKLKTLLENDEIAFDDIAIQYKSWRGNLLKYNSYKSIKSMDLYFKKLYGKGVD